MKFGSSFQDGLWCDHGLVAGILFIGSDSWRIHCLEAMDEPLLSAQDVPPRIPPCFGGIDDLPDRNQSFLLDETQAITYLGKHLVGIFEILQQDTDL